MSFLKTVVLLLLMLMVNTLCIAQEKLTWFDFADVTYSRVYNEQYGDFFEVPKFGPIITSYEGKVITIKGYFLDIAGSGSVTLLSKNSMASCFFCGGSGPETVIEVNFKNSPSFETDQIIMVIGTLQLNTDNLYNCNYILNDAEGRLADE